MMNDLDMVAEALLQHPGGGGGQGRKSLSLKPNPTAKHDPAFNKKVKLVFK